MTKRGVWIALSIITALSLSGCCCLCFAGNNGSWRVARTVNTGQAQRVTHQIRLEGAEQVEVTVQFAGGTLDVDGGSDDLFDGEFVYNLDDLEPTVEYDVKGKKGELLVRHKEDTIRWDLSTEVRNEWQIRFSNDIPLDLSLQVGASTGSLDLGGMRLTRLRLDAGAADMTVRFGEANPERLESLSVRSGAARLSLLELGNANLEDLEFDGGLGSYTLDFTGEWQHSAQVHIQAGASQVTLNVPQDIGVRICPGDLRSGDYDGLSKQGDCYVNNLYEQADIQLEIDLDLGLGHLQVRQIN